MAVQRIEVRRSRKGTIVQRWDKAERGAKVLVAQLTLPVNAKAASHEAELVAKGILPARRPA